MQPGFTSPTIPALRITICRLGDIIADAEAYTADMIYRFGVLNVYEEFVKVLPALIGENLGEKEKKIEDISYALKKLGEIIEET